MTNDDTNAMLGVGLLLGSIGVVGIVFKPVFGPDSEQEQKIRQAWGMTKRETLPFVCGILFLITGAFFVITALAFKFAGAKT